MVMVGVGRPVGATGVLSLCCEGDGRGIAQKIAEVGPQVTGTVEWLGIVVDATAVYGAIEIKLSNNHNCQGVPAGTYYDICDRLQGRYPKDFKFTGWHPHCRCHAVSILKTPKEIAEDTRKILNGEPVDGNSVNRVNDVPQEFKEWIADNADRAARSMSMPYFIKDNM